ncbi:Hyaluronan synthase [Fusobacterium necrogenes]|uniref:Hyaluronan synthase n=1 Tax=Fusobacterium necrogenes TaxID=858 RepID=A0A377GWD7_9FUSO|nr:glycosyltransferase family 2 protein [Fusobacterium necrogenes]STO31278.1 Hyaluronan synthase [Fusobacterium necrogenes]
MLTIFTPVYNRVDTLKRLYESLLRQTSKEFQWIVVDDGSTDGSGELVQNFQKSSPFEIIYKYMQNGGKMRAINEGVTLANGEFFLIVDSDDYVSNECVEKILFFAETLPESMGGLVFRKIDIKNKKITGKPYPKNIIDSSPIEIVYNYGIVGDKAEVFKTKLLKENPFFVYEGEKFIPEAIIWIKIGEKYKMRYIDEGIYYFEYLEDGYTKNFKKLLKNNPRGFGDYYMSMLSYPLPLKNKIKFLLRYIQAKFYIYMAERRKY